MAMFGDFNKREFIQTGLGATGMIIMGYLSMLVVLLIIS